MTTPAQLPERLEEAAGDLENGRTGTSKSEAVDLLRESAAAIEELTARCERRGVALEEAARSLDVAAGLRDELGEPRLGSLYRSWAASARLSVEEPR